MAASIAVFMPVSTIHITRYHAPCGTLILGAFEGRLCLCDWQTEQHREFVDKRLQQNLKAEIRVLDNELKSEELKGKRISGKMAKSGWSDIAVLQEAKRQLDEYFRKERKAFDLPLLFVGTDFQKRVWEALRHIPYGTTVSYKELASLIGQPQAVRAVANANRQNAVSIILPCHRVIGTDGSLTGYGGRLDIKQYLLDMEQATLF